MPVQDLIRQKKVPQDSGYYFDPPYRGETGQHSRWRPEDSDQIGRIFQWAAKQGKPVAWHDSAHPANLKFVEESEGGHHSLAQRLDQAQKTKDKANQEMFAFANMPWLDPEEVATWTDSTGAWTP